VAYFEWGDDLTVGNEFLDSDHQKLISLVNQLHTATQQGEGRTVVGEILDELLDYTKDHFQREESHMQRISYADYAAHKSEHVSLVNEVMALKAQFDAGNISVAAKVSQLLREWLSVHIMKTDKAFAVRLNAAT